jgi:hypothetical protein
VVERDERREEREERREEIRTKARRLRSAGSACGGAGDEKCACVGIAVWTPPTAVGGLFPAFPLIY